MKMAWIFICHISIIEGICVYIYETICDIKICGCSGSIRPRVTGAPARKGGGKTDNFDDRDFLHVDLCTAGERGIYDVCTCTCTSYMCARRVHTNTYIPVEVV